MSNHSALRNKSVAVNDKSTLADGTEANAGAFASARRRAHAAKIQASSRVASHIASLTRTVDGTVSVPGTTSFEDFSVATALHAFPGLASVRSPGETEEQLSDLAREFWDRFPGEKRDLSGLHWSAKDAWDDMSDDSSSEELPWIVGETTERGMSSFVASGGEAKLDPAAEAAVAVTEWARAEGVPDARVTELFTAARTSADTFVVRDADESLRAGMVGVLTDAFGAEAARTILYDAEFLFNNPAQFYQQTRSTPMDVIEFAKTQTQRVTNNATHASFASDGADPDALSLAAQAGIFFRHAETEGDNTCVVHDGERLMLSTVDGGLRVTDSDGGEHVFEVPAQARDWVSERGGRRADARTAADAKRAFAGSGVSVGYTYGADGGEFAFDFEDGSSAKAVVQRGADIRYEGNLDALIGEIPQFVRQHADPGQYLENALRQADGGAVYAKGLLGRVADRRARLAGPLEAERRRVDLHVSLQEEGFREVLVSQFDRHVDGTRIAGAKVEIGPERYGVHAVPDGRLVFSGPGGKMVSDPRLAASKSAGTGRPSSKAMKFFDWAGQNREGLFDLTDAAQHHMV